MLCDSAFWTILQCGRPMRTAYHDLSLRSVTEALRRQHRQWIQTEICSSDWPLRSVSHAGTRAHRILARTCALSHKTIRHCNSTVEWKSFGTNVAKRSCGCSVIVSRYAITIRSHIQCVNVAFFVVVSPAENHDRHNQSARDQFQNTGHQRRGASEWQSMCIEWASYLKLRLS